MNDSIKGELLYYDYNSRKSCIVCGTTMGFYIYTIDDSKNTINTIIMGGVKLIQLYKMTNILFFVGSGNNLEYLPNELILWDDQQRKIIQKIKFPINIEKIKANDNYLSIASKTHICIYDLRNKLTNFRNIFSARYYSDTITRFELNDISTENYLLVFSLNKTKLCLKTNNDKIEFTPHKNPIQSFNCSGDGKYIATTSVYNTLIRIFTDKGTLIKELRYNGNIIEKIINIKNINLEFSYDNSLIGSINNSGTIQIFNTDLVDTKYKNFKLNIPIISSIIPQDWEYCRFTIPNSLCKLIFLNNFILVINNFGKLYKLKLMKPECKLEYMKTYIYSEYDSIFQ